ncbi:MAG: ribosomal protein S18-alanine N-acetyltransferase [Candidatus Thorarchaeota archaeon]
MMIFDRESDEEIILGYKIRPILSRDLDDVIRIENQCFKQPWDMSVFSFLAERHGVILEHDREIGMWVVTNQEDVVAYLVWEYDTQRRKGHIQNIAVDKNHRRRGIASFLLQRFFSKLKDGKADQCILEVRESNTGAIKFYEKMGMTPISRHEGFYGDEDAIIYHVSF